MINTGKERRQRKMSGQELVNVVWRRGPWMSPRGQMAVKEAEGVVERPVIHQCGIIISRIPSYLQMLDLQERLPRNLL